ncbi:diacylglycerol/lipid kinase family protein [Allonocardiopsis opalescens]|uniref:Diacylglycerol kinase family enzyme n=1 Tax=Allonocardiopsis opalescens TaxID=1144618 RepID=A0A2T0QAH5_9ACTN|nr:diacylglycerol kinase family protein [Allonocardiopsis opalescens]PRY00843.1 diacylglycerol kinase family enzyme [Allonocardiopsis opalescens]
MLIVTNSAAGGTDDDTVRLVVAELGEGVDTAGSTDPAQLDELLDRGHDTVVVAGGDGSLHAVVNALYRRGELADRIVGLVPLGTGNDFAQGMGIPLDAAEAARLLRGRRPTPVDLLVDDTGEVTVNAVHLGVGAEATRAAQNWKPLLGPAGFPVGGVLAGVSAKGWHARVEVDGRALVDNDLEILMVGLANGPFIGGATGVLSPDARPDDGLVDVVVSHATGIASRVAYAMDLHRGEHHARADVTFLQGREVAVTGGPFAISADGEFSEGLESRTWRVLPGALNFLAPPVEDRPATTRP